MSNDEEMLKNFKRTKRALNRVKNDLEYTERKLEYDKPAAVLPLYIALALDLVTIVTISAGYPELSVQFSLLAVGCWCLSAFAKMCANTVRETAVEEILEIIKRKKDHINT